MEFPETLMTPIIEPPYIKEIIFKQRSIINWLGKTIVLSSKPRISYLSFKSQLK